MKIGVLALQGAFEEHIKKLEELGVEAYEIRRLRDLDEKPDGLIIPGGESTVMSKLLDDLGCKSTECQHLKFQGRIIGSDDSRSWKGDRVGHER